MAHKFLRALSGVLTAALLTATVLPGSANALQYEGSPQYMSGKYYDALCRVELTGDQRVDIVNIALSQAGYQEGGNWASLSGEVYGGVNYTEFGYWYGMQDMWCAMFVSWCAHVAGVPENVIPKHAYTPDGLRWFRNKKRSYSQAQLAAGEYTPQPGDLIYFRSARNNNSTNHVGLVTGFYDGMIHTLEGNISSVSEYTNGGMVAPHSYSVSNPYIVAVCSPNYAQTGASAIPYDPAAELRQAVVAAEGGRYDAVSPAGGLGIGQWQGNRARDLLKRIQHTNPDAFQALDTAGIGEHLDRDWTHFRPDEDTRNCLSAILGSETGRSVQDALLERQISDYLTRAEELGIESLRAQAIFGLICHLAGAPAAQRLAAACPERTSEALISALPSCGLGHLTRLVEML